MRRIHWSIPACSLILSLATIGESADLLDETKIRNAVMQRFDENRNDKLESVEARSARARLKTLLEDKTSREIGILIWREDIRELLQSLDQDGDDRLTPEERDRGVLILERLIPKAERTPKEETSLPRETGEKTSGKSRRPRASTGQRGGIGGGAIGGGGFGMRQGYVVGLDGRYSSWDDVFSGKNSGSGGGSSGGSTLGGTSGSASSSGGAGASASSGKMEGSEGGGSSASGSGMSSGAGMKQGSLGQGPLADSRSGGQSSGSSGRESGTVREGQPPSGSAGSPSDPLAAAGGAKPPSGSPEGALPGGGAGGSGGTTFKPPVKPNF